MMLQDMAADLAMTDPTTRVRPPVRPRSHGAWHHERVPLSRDQLDAVLRAVREHDGWYFPAILTMAWTGARESEIRCLRWEDVDLDELALTVRTTKTARHGDADRPLPLHPEFADVLREHRRELVRQQHPGLATGLVFPAERGKQLQRGRLRVVLVRAQARAGIDQRVRPHVLRRTLNVLLRRASDDTSLRLAWMGHTSEGVNRLYDHVAMEEKRAVLTALNVE